MGQQQAVPAANANCEARSTFSTSSKRLRRKLRKSFRSNRNRSYRDLSATFQYNLNNNSDYELLNLNTASEDELMTLTGISRKIARGIIEHRSAIGGFQKVEDLAVVAGVGAARLELLRNDVCVKNNLLSSTSHSLDSLSIAGRVSAPRVNINTASMFDLMAIPGLTQNLAASICHFREKKSRFKNVEALLKVKAMTPAKFALIRPFLSIGDTTLETSSAKNGSDKDSRTHTPTSPNPSMRSRKTRRAEVSDSIDLDIYRLVSHLAVRPMGTKAEPSNVSQNRLRIALWHLENMTSEKASNLGVQEVICRTILENAISILVCQDVQSFIVGDRLIAELNQPILSRVVSWESQERHWRAVFPRRIDQRESGTFSPTNQLRENSTGILYSGANGLHHLEVKLVELREDLAPALVTHFEIFGSFRISVVSIDLSGSDPSALSNTLTGFIGKLSNVLMDSKNIVVCGNFLKSPTDQAFDEMICLGFHLLHPISVQEDDHFHIWCSTSVGALCLAEEAVQIRQGLSHPMIPRGRWHFGGTVSSHKPVVIELGISEPNEVIFSHDHVLNNGMVSAD